MDRDLQSIQQARDAVDHAHAAAHAFRRAEQVDVDRIVDAMGRAAEAAAEDLARQAVGETGMGRYADKVIKNRFSAVDVREYVKPLKTTGVIRDLPDVGVTELAVPMGVVAALIPTTNPTSTVIYKALIAVKARNAIVMSPHPRAVSCCVNTARVLMDAARAAGAPDGLISCLDMPSLEATNELMRHPRTAVILATGGSPMVRAAYSSGKPAYGVGPGNVPAIVERTADVNQAVRDVIAGKSFDNGLLCSAENSLICDAPVESAVRAALRTERAHVLSASETRSLESVMKDPATGGISGSVVGQSAPDIASRAGLTVPANTRVLVVECSDVGKQTFFSREKLSPVLALYVEDGWEACCERSIELLEFGGIGHSLVLHSTDEAVIQAFFEEKPAFRIMVNTVSAVGAVGVTTGLAPAMTLGPGTWGGSSTSDNITPLHLINIKRLARGIAPFTATDQPPEAEAGEPEGVEAPSDQDIRAAVEAFLAERMAARNRT